MARRFTRLICRIESSSFVGRAMPAGSDFLLNPEAHPEQELSSSFGGRGTSLLLVHIRAGARMNSEAGPRGGGQDARSKREVPKRKRHPASALSGLPARKVRVRVTGRAAGHRGPHSSEKPKAAARRVRFRCSWQLSPLTPSARTASCSAGRVIPESSLQEK
jgi:hypothetical protein